MAADRPAGPPPTTITSNMKPPFGQGLCFVVEAVFGEQAGWSPREASDSDDVVGDGGPLLVRAGSLALAGFEPFGVPFVGAQFERGQCLLGVGPRPAVDRGVVDDQQEATGRYGARRLLQDVDAGKLYRRVQVLGGDQVEGARREGEGEVVPLEV